MECSIVYYTAHKTALCEKQLKRSFSELGLTLASAVFAAGNEALGEALTRAFAGTDVVFTVGGLSFGDQRGIRDIVSQAAAGSRPSLCRKLKNDSGSDGYLLRAGRQLLVMLPDEPAQIETMLRGTTAAYIKSM